MPPLCVIIAPFYWPTTQAGLTFPKLKRHEKFWWCQGFYPDPLDPVTLLLLGYTGFALGDVIDTTQIIEKPSLSAKLSFPLNNRGWINQIKLINSQ